MKTCVNNNSDMSTTDNIFAGSNNISASNNNSASYNWKWYINNISINMSRCYHENNINNINNNNDYNNNLSSTPTETITVMWAASSVASSEYCLQWIYFCDVMEWRRGVTLWHRSDVMGLEWCFGVQKLSVFRWWTIAVDVKNTVRSFHFPNYVFRVRAHFWKWGWVWDPHALD